ncbi:hypothetical protein [Pseudomonas petrae]|uniref:BssS protein family protein n=1 Tax=Pseudomonas petrae TaxID=2912190 RepID=A0ABS9ICU6_9PSED|nr:hypothetical protein [Pseudomonas petrae]MCF7545291.1 hypothetical protein [Pseudomonas petrae]
MTQETAVNPITGWEIATIPAMEAVRLQFSFISTPFQKLEEAQTGPAHLMTIAQARELIEALKKSVERLESRGPTQAPGRQH